MYLLKNERLRHPKVNFQAKNLLEIIVTVLKAVVIN